MNITVFGANGRVGRLVVRRALLQDHQVRAFVHSNNPFDPSERLDVLSGDVADPGAVASAVEGSDAVVSTLGAFRRRTGPVLGPGLRIIGQAMNHHGTSRLVMLTGAGVLHPGLRGRTRTRVNRVILTLMDRTAVADVDDALAGLAGTGLAWTAVCAPTITADGSESYLLLDRMPSLLAKISGPAVAAGLVALAEQPTATDPVVGIEQR